MIPMPVVCTAARRMYAAGILARSRPNVTFRETLHILYARLGAETIEAGCERGTSDIEMRLES